MTWMQSDAMKNMTNMRTTTRRGPPTVQDLEEAIDSLRSFDGIIIVEGKRDVAALKKLDVTKNVIHLDAPLFEIVERVADSLGPHQKVIILTDLDREGKKIYHELSMQFQRMHVKIDDRFRELLFHTPLRHIEGLDTFVANLAQKDAGTR